MASYNENIETPAATLSMPRVSPAPNFRIIALPCWPRPMTGRWHHAAVVGAVLALILPQTLDGHHGDVGTVPMIVTSTVGMVGAHVMMAAHERNPVVRGSRTHRRAS
jgi:hypothetical protein